MEDPVIEQTAHFLWRTACSLSTSCPAASRYYMTTLRGHLGNDLMTKTFCKPFANCKYCGSLFRHLNHKIRIQPIPAPNCHIRKLIKLEKGQPWKLNNRQKKKLKKYRESTNKIIYTCNVCKKTMTCSGLKKYRPREQDMSMNIPTPKIKLKKGDLNAGLFIRTPTEKKVENTLVEDIQDDEVPSKETSTPKLMIDASNLQTSEKAPFTSKMKQSTTPQVISSNKKKRKKGLLAHILNQEQEAKKLKKNLSSFLTL